MRERLVAGLTKTVMKNYVEHFEIFVIRPIWALTFVVGVVSLFRESWLSLVGCALGWLCIAGVGQGLHPLQSPHDLSQGPLESQGAIREAAMLTVEDQLVLVRQACTRTAILIGMALFVVLLTIARWHWYWAALAAWFGCVSVGAVPIVAFCTLRQP